MRYNCGGCGKDLTKRGTLKVWLSGRQGPVPGHMADLEPGGGIDGEGSWNAEPDLKKDRDSDYCRLEAYCKACGAQSA